jgi:hypothetical protein
MTRLILAALALFIIANGEWRMANGEWRYVAADAE